VEGGGTVPLSSTVDPMRECRCFEMCNVAATLSAQRGRFGEGEDRSRRKLPERKVRFLSTISTSLSSSTYSQFIDRLPVGIESVY
jgi:hypothetical protein